MDRKGDAHICVSIALKLACTIQGRTHLLNNPFALSTLSSSWWTRYHDLQRSGLISLVAAKDSTSVVTSQVEARKQLNPLTATALQQRPLCRRASRLQLLMFAELGALQDHPEAYSSSQKRYLRPFRPVRRLKLSSTYVLLSASFSEHRFETI